MVLGHVRKKGRIKETGVIFISDEITIMILSNNTKLDVKWMRNEKKIMNG